MNWVSLLGFILGMLAGAYMAWIMMLQRQTAMTEHCLLVYHDSESKLALAQEYEQKADRLHAEAKEFLERASATIEDWAAK